MKQIAFILVVVALIVSLLFNVVRCSRPDVFENCFKGVPDPNGYLAARSRELTSLLRDHPGITNDPDAPCVTIRDVNGLGFKPKDDLLEDGALSYAKFAESFKKEREQSWEDFSSRMEKTLAELRQDDGSERLQTKAEAVRAAAAKLLEQAERQGIDSTAVKAIEKQASSISQEAKAYGGTLLRMRDNLEPVAKQYEAIRARIDDMKKGREPVTDEVMSRAINELLTKSEGFRKGLGDPFPKEYGEGIQSIAQLKDFLKDKSEGVRKSAQELSSLPAALQSIDEAMADVRERFPETLAAPLRNSVAELDSAAIVFANNAAAIIAAAPIVAESVSALISVIAANPAVAVVFAILLLMLSLGGGGGGGVDNPVEPGVPGEHPGKPGDPEVKLNPGITRPMPEMPAEATDAGIGSAGTGEMEWVSYWTGQELHFRFSWPRDEGGRRRDAYKSLKLTPASVPSALMVRFTEARESRRNLNVQRYVPGPPPAHFPFSIFVSGMNDRTGGDVQITWTSEDKVEVKGLEARASDSR